MEEKQTDELSKALDLWKEALLERGKNIKKVLKHITEALEKLDQMEKHNQ